VGKEWRLDVYQVAALARHGAQAALELAPAHHAILRIERHRPRGHTHHVVVGFRGRLLQIGRSDQGGIASEPR
jgi:hypothetical protein